MSGIGIVVKDGYDFSIWNLAKPDRELHAGTDPERNYRNILGMRTSRDYRSFSHT